MYNRGDILNNVCNITKGITTIILAAGEGKRMFSKTPKVLQKVCGVPMVQHVVNCAMELGCSKPIVVVGHAADEVMKTITDAMFVMQAEQLGTGHAVMQANDYIGSSDILILYGDTPLIEAETLLNMYITYKQHNYGVAVLTADYEDPTGYGRIIRNKDGLVDGIIEERDADPETKKITEINSGMYFFKGDELKKALDLLSNDNDQGEYYLTDVIEHFKKSGYKIGAFKTKSSEEIMGVNNKLQLSEATAAMRKRILNRHMLDGVTIVDPVNTYIESTVRISRDVTLYPGCILEGNTIIGEDSIIGPNTKINNCAIGRGVKIQYSVLSDSSIDDETSVGPFAYLRPGNKIGKHAKIGDFVEMKNSNFGDYSKASHLTYVGDGDVGDNVNLGCGVVFVNYDGTKKHRTVVEDNSFIGCNVNLIAPVTVRENSYVAAGTTVTKEVPKENMAIGRVKQENKEGWARRFKKSKE